VANKGAGASSRMLDVQIRLELEGELED